MEWFDEVSIEGYPAACNYTGIWLSHMIAQHIVLCAHDTHNIVGVIGMKVGNMPWNDEVQILSNEFLIVKKEHRNLGVTDKLIKSVKDLADKGKLLILMSHITGTASELKDRYLRIKGFSYGGGNFIYKGVE